MRTQEVAVPLFALQSSGLWTYAKGLFSALPNESRVGMRYLHNGRDLPFTGAANRSRSFLHAMRDLGRERFRGICHYPVGNRRLFPLPGAINVTTVHDIAEYHIPGRFGWKRDLMLKRVLVPMLTRMDHVIAVSHQTKRDLLAFTKVAPERITVIHNGVNEKVFSPASEEERERVRQQYDLPKEFWIVVSRIEHPVKNHYTLMRAYAMLKQRGYDLPPMIFVGALDKDAHVILRTIVDLGLANDVKVPGFIPLDDVVALLSAARSSIYPSVFEGFGLPILESLACGTPVMCSQIPVFDEFVPDGTPRFDPHSIDELAQCLRKNLQHAPDTVSLPPRFRWQHCAAQTMNLYESLLC